MGRSDPLAAGALTPVGGTALREGDGGPCRPIGRTGSLRRAMKLRLTERSRWPAAPSAGCPCAWRARQHPDRLLCIHSIPSRAAGMNAQLKERPASETVHEMEGMQVQARLMQGRRSYLGEFNARSADASNRLAIFKSG